jgi:hypothetical protein
MANDIFRFYAEDPEFVFSYLRNHWRDAVVRWDGRKVGASNIWLMVVVLDQSAAVTAFRRWLSEHGTTGDLLIRKWPFPPIMTVPNTIVVRRRWRILNWPRLRALRTGGQP